MALELDIPEEVVEKIDVDRSTVSDKCYSVFSTWLKSFTNDKLCWCRIVDAFKMAGRVDVAEKIKESHISMFLSYVPCTHTIIIMLVINYYSVSTIEGLSFDGQETADIMAY